MNRRNFIFMSGMSLSGMLLSDNVVAFAPLARLVRMPESVSVVLRDGVHHLVPGRSNNWSFRDICVKLRYNSRSLIVQVSSPKEALSNVILEWKYDSANSKLLGDHLERTYGDVHFQSATFARKMPWYFIQHNGLDTNCFGVKTGGSTLCYWQTGEGKMQLVMDTRNGGRGVLLGDRTLDAAEIIATQNRSNENAFATARRFCSMMCEHPLVPKKPVYGINDWYITYGANSADIILNHTARMTGLATSTDNRPFSVIDSGWAKYSPLLPGDCCWQDDFSQANDHFKDMAVLADNITKLGMQPGLWTRPLCAAHNDAKNLLLPPIPGRSSIKKPVLDPSITENLERVRRNVRLYQEWGYKLVKHDFTTYDLLGKWGFQMDADITTANWGFNDPSKTTAEIMLDLYKTIREAADNMYILGCNTVSHLSAGIFELNRIGDDTSGKEWDRTRKMGVNTLGFRMVQHNTFYAVDGDCVGLTNAIPWAKNKQWMKLLAESSSPLFISAQEAATGEEQRAYIKTCFALAAQRLPVAEPLDWLEQQWPQQWMLNGHAVQFNWD